MPDGNEVTMLSTVRGWSALLDEQGAGSKDSSSKDFQDCKELVHKLFELDEDAPEISVLDYLVRGADIPQGLLALTMFARLHQAQLEVSIWHQNWIGCGYSLIVLFLWLFFSFLFFFFDFVIAIGSPFVAVASSLQEAKR